MCDDVMEDKYFPYIDHRLELASVVFCTLIRQLRVLTGKKDWF